MEQLTVTKITARELWDILYLPFKEAGIDLETLIAPDGRQYYSVASSYVLDGPVIGTVSDFIKQEVTEDYRLQHNHVMASILASLAHDGQIPKTDYVFVGEPFGGWGGVEYEVHRQS